MREKPTFLKSRDVAHILDMSPDDAMDLARRGRLKAVKEGRYWKYRYKDVMAYKKRMGKKT